ncbi:MAG: thiamine pyrophosphate-dependent enzyme, partial [Nitrososphaerales archaeon]
HNDAEHNMLIARSRNRDEDSAYRVGGELVAPQVDYGKLAQSFGVSGLGPIERPEDLRPSIENAIKTVMSEHRPALVDVITQKR